MDAFELMYVICASVVLAVLAAGILYALRALLDSTHDDKEYDR